MGPEEKFGVDRLWPDPRADLDLDEAFADLALPDAPTGRAWLGLNMVTSIDGRATREGGAEGISGRADRRLMRLLRVAYDAVATGSGTLRAHDFFSRVPADLVARRVERGRTPQPVAVVIAGSGPIPVERRFFRGDQQRLVIVGAGRDADRTAALESVAEVVIAPTPAPEPKWVLQTLRKRGIEHVLLEGGPTTNAAFLAGDLIDELYWTVGAGLIGNDGLPMIAPIPGGSPWERAPRRGRLISCHKSGDDLFLRYRFHAIA